jgi:hypothetical protein
MLILLAGDYAEVTIEPHSKRGLPDDKQDILDVKVKTVAGKKIDVETQIVNQPDLRNSPSPAPRLPYPIISCCKKGGTHISRARVK